VRPQLCDQFLRRWTGGILDGLISLLKSDRTVAIPKFTSRNELLSCIANGIPFDADGKTLATFILEPGEYTKPLPILQPGERYHLLQEALVNGQSVQFATDAAVTELNSILQDLRVVYYRPYSWLPAIRLEIPGNIAASTSRLSLALEGVVRQLFSPAVFEPYPLFLADRMVKSLGAGVAVIEQAVAQHVAGRRLTSRPRCYVSRIIEQKVAKEEHSARPESRYRRRRQSIDKYRADSRSAARGY